ncbi:MAG: 23S rRNA (pseudouridine(1915)-N(3))-methyltransferase RlmH [Lachnospiraceae bacterium]|nr:23S rRNA (pseudouridine(1915)-N(3))-methyltransferase RlmH [Lachnospiraceae bacterium]
MKITIIGVGKIKEAYFRDALAEYSKRLSKYCKFQIIEVTDEECPENASEAEEQQVKDREGERILKKIPGGAHVIALAIDGKKTDSVGFSKEMERIFVSGKNEICFIIGGSIGLSKIVLDASNQKLSFSDMTFPHQLMRVILSEQIYRAFRIMNHEPYHK